MDKLHFQIHSQEGGMGGDGPLILDRARILLQYHLYVWY